MRLWVLTWLYDIRWSRNASKPWNMGKPALMCLAQMRGLRAGYRHHPTWLRSDYAAWHLTLGSLYRDEFRGV